MDEGQPTIPVNHRRELQIGTADEKPLAGVTRRVRPDGQRDQVRPGHGRHRSDVVRRDDGDPLDPEREFCPYTWTKEER